MRVDRALKVAIGFGAVASAVLFGVDVTHGPHFLHAPAHPVAVTGEVVPLRCREGTVYLTAHNAAIHQAAFVAAIAAVAVTGAMVFWMLRRRRARRLTRG